MIEANPAQVLPNTPLPKVDEPKVDEPKADETEFQPVSATENPTGDGIMSGVRGGANMYGGCSIEVSCGCAFGALSYTHEDAQGWLDYVNRFTPINFWYKDCGVQPWIYYEPYDDWQDTYGVDAVTAFYHSGHGGMDANGVFYLPMSKSWGSEGCTIISSNDKLLWGNERIRYIFLSTCLSLRVLDGHNPIRTWHRGNRGWRMLFGFETISWDNPNYGKFFWEEWNKGKSLSTAWLDASWRIAHNQAPSVVACGATAEEAKDRLYNERLFYRERVSTNYYWWRWYYASTSATVREPQLTLPQTLMLARLQPVSANRQSASMLAERFQMEMDISAEVASSPDGSYRVASGEQSIAYGSDGSFEVRLAKPNLDNRTPLAVENATSLAQEAVWRYGLDRDAPVMLDQVLVSLEGGGSTDGLQVEGPYTTGTVIQFRQVINGVAVITPDAGTIRVSIDNDGRVTDVHSSVRTVEQLSTRSIRSNAPIPEGFTTSTLAPEPANYEQSLAAEFSKQLTAWATKGGGMPLEYSTVPDSTEIGYDIQGNEAVLIARKAVEVDFGSGYRKRYWVKVPLFV